MHARDKWLFGGVFGPLMAIIGTFAFESVPPSLQLGPSAALVFAAVCCAIVGYPLSRALSRHLVFWEPRDPKTLKQVRLRRAREDDE